jgi:hypothetical protein
MLVVSPVMVTALLRLFDAQVALIAVVPTLMVVLAIIPLICDRLMWPLLSPSGIPAHVPGVPAATFTHAATPFAVAPEF